MNIKTKFLLWVLYLFFSKAIVCIGADRNIRFTHLTNDQGLPTNTVHSLCQDYKGFIWIGTKNGLCKYDGKSISIYNIEIEAGNRKKEGIIRHIFEDNRQRLWIVTSKSVNLYDRNQDKFNIVQADSLNDFCRVIYQGDDGTIYLGGSGAFVYNEKRNCFDPFYINQDERITANLTAITSNRKGQLWMGRMYGGLICVDTQKGKVNRYKHYANNPSSLVSDKIVSLFSDKKRNIWIGTEKGICRFDEQTKNFTRIDGFPQICVRTFAEDQYGNIWIGSEDGLYIYSPKSGKFVNYKQNYNDKYSLNDNAIYTIFKDKENNMLIGTYFGGINISLSSFRQFFYFDYGYSDKSLSGKAVRQIIGDPNENLWIATEDGGLNHYDKSKKKFEHFKPIHGQNSLSYHNVHSLLLDKHNNLWIGTYLGGLNKYNLRTKQFTHYTSSMYPNLVTNNIFSLLEDRDGEIWIGTTNGLSIYNEQKNEFRRFEEQVIISKNIDHLFQDSEGYIWISTRTNGVYRYNKATLNLQNYSVRPDGTGISNNYVTYIFEDHKKNIWLGTYEGGLCSFNKQKEKFTVYTIDNGLPSNTVFSITESHSGNLWLSTNNGLSSLNTNTNTFTNYSVSEGLPNKQFNYNSAYTATDGLLYFGTINGMIAFYPKDLQTIQNAAQVEFTDFKIFGKSMIPGDKESPLKRNVEEAQEIHLNNEQAKSFTFEFTVPTISHPNSTFFAIKFNTEKEWSYIGLQNQLTYANLPEGEYILNVKAAFNNKWDGTEPIKSIKIIIDPPVWRSKIAYLIYTAFAALFIAGLYLFIKRRQREKSLILSERLEKKKMREINSLKINFFTNISHELRTPLSLILIPLESFIEKNIFSPEIRPKMRLIANNARRMNNLVEELMLFSKIETKQEKIRIKRGNLLNFISNISAEFQLLAEERGLNFILEIDYSEEEVWFAPVKVEKIIYNLLSNAFKYTEKGEIRVKAFYERTSKYTYLHFIVSDTGIGIAADQKEKIFENYYQVNDFVKSMKTGFGIGLALTRELVLLHKGTINVDSILGEGTQFSISLNISADAFSPEEISDKNADEQFMSGYKFMPARRNTSEESLEEGFGKTITDRQYKLLIVEDNLELLSTYKELFSDIYTVITAENGKGGYLAAKSHLPDIIISDVMMPEMNGFELAHKLKSRIETCHIPLLLLTAKTGEEAQLEGYESGADLYVEKPFHPALLQKQISNLIATKENQKKLFIANKVEISEIKANDRDKKLISDIEKLIIDNLDNKDFSLNYLLKEIGIGRTLLHVKLKNIVGLSATEFINNVRLKESLKLLAVGQNISEAAYASGFASPNYYSRCFKRFFGTSPNEYLQKQNGVKEDDKQTRTIFNNEVK